MGNGLKKLGPAGPLLLGLVGAACGGGSTSPSAPTEPSVPTYSVTATVFYDENGNGQLDPGEGARVPGVEVLIGTGTATSAPGTGQAVVAGIREGLLSAGVRTETMPAYYQPSAPIPVQVPGTSEVRCPLTLPIGDNNPNLYMGYGDSITAGEGSSDGHGYVLRLQNLLGPYFARAEVQARGRGGTNSAEGAEAARRNIRIFHPAWVLVHYGTNDWNDATCQKQVDACFTIDSLRRIVEEVKDANSLPVLATIIPANPALVPSGRNTWYDEMNVRIKALAREENVTLADLNADFKAAGNLPALYADHVHPNDAGYQVMAQGWFKAITRSRSAAAAASPRFGLGFRP